MTLFGDNGLISMAQKEKSETENLQANTIAGIHSLLNEMSSDLNENGDNGGNTPPANPGPTTPTDEPLGPNKKPLVTNNSLKEIDTTKNREVEDAQGNKIVIPKGFKIAEDSGATVQEGIVIEDDAATQAVGTEGTTGYKPATTGNQFVWIPVGNVNIIKNGKTESVNIDLARYDFTTSDSTVTNSRTPKQLASNYATPTDFTPTGKSYKVIEYAERTNPDGVALKGKDGLNAIAKDLEGFVGSVQTNGGYYIARYEASYGDGYKSNESGDAARYGSAKPLSKKSTAKSDESMNYTKGTLWNFITQLNATKVCQNMYSDTDIGVKSDLVNSYAWDTAIIYIEKMQTANKDYAHQTDGSGILKNTGYTGDEKCKINDMAKNVREWTTEYAFSTTDSSVSPCVTRGGSYGYGVFFAADRNTSDATHSNFAFGFRPFLYVTN